MTTYVLDLKQPEISYMFGFMQADGHLYQTTQNRGKMIVELAKSDSHLLLRFKDLITCNSYLGERTRDTNFKSGYTSTSLSVHDLGFRTAINKAGIPYGPKSKVIAPPKESYSQSDYWRGIIDADGSLGITSQGFPFCSLITTSDALAVAFFDLIEAHCGYRPNVNPNKRDRAYNIVVIKEAAQKLVNFLYKDACIGLDRKSAEAHNIMQWKRSVDSRPKNERLWSIKEKEYAISHSIEETIKFTKRTKIAVEGMVRKLKRNQR